VTGRDEDPELAALRAENLTLRRRVADLEETLQTTTDQLDAAVRRRVADLEAVLQATIDRVDAVIYLRDPGGAFTFVNDAWVRVVGLARDAVIGKTDEDLFPPAVYEGFRVADRHVRETHEIHEREEQLPQPDGLHIYRSLKFPVLAADGAFITLGGISTDLTAQRRAEANLRTTQSLLRAVLDNSPLLINAVDRDGRFILVSRETARRVGLTPDEVLGRDAREVLSAASADSLRTHVDVVLRTGQALVAEQVGDDPDDPHVLLVTRFPIRDVAGTIHAVGSVAADITDLRRGEAERVRLQQAVIAAQEAALAELEAPIVPIAGRALACPLVGTLDPRRMARLTEALLDRIDAGDARVVVLDLTGVRDVETAISSGLIAVVAAIHLLGVETVLTGIQPAVARTLVQQGVQLRHITILQTLQHGIEYALARLQPSTPASR
jgi:rsbT co-antagonist protein RsbR